MSEKGQVPVSPARKSTDPQPAEPATYEQARDELAQVVATLETGGLSLDDSLQLWERGEHLAAVCERFLDGARQRVEAALAAAEDEDPQ